jgi:hypothetical protein
MVIENGTGSGVGSTSVVANGDGCDGADDGDNIPLVVVMALAGDGGIEMVGYKAQ